MSAAWATVIAACIAAGSAVLVAFINKFRQENRKDHGQVMTVLGAITRILTDHSGQLGKVEEKVDSLREDFNTHTH